MDVTVVSPGSGWVLDSISRRLCAADPAHFSQHSYGEASEWLIVPTDVVYHVDVQNTWHAVMSGHPPGALHVGMFTHLDGGSVDAWRPHWAGLDGAVHMAQRYFDVFVQQGWYPPERMTVLRPGQPVPDISLKPLRVGICQRGGHVGKGKDFLPEAVKLLTPEIRAGLHLVFCGQGWGPAHEENQGYGSYHGIAATYLREAHYQTLYEMVDVFLIPSLYEGGPMALLEALAAGLPVIAADVGWVRDLHEDLCRRAGGWAPVGFSIYRPGDVGDLTGLLSIPVQDRLDRRAAVEGMSYKHYAADLLAFCEHLQEMRRG